MFVPVKIQTLWGQGLALAMMLLLLTACFNANQNNGNEADEGKGELYLSLTDAKGDFINYLVDVKSISLTRANGQTIETLALNSQIDFAQYVNMTEFLTAATVPLGRYVRAEMVLDYTNAQITVEDENGLAKTVDSIVDADGNPLEQASVSVILEGRSGLVIAPGIPSHLNLDFDLAASNQVEFADDGTVRLAVSPVLVADLDFYKHKQHRVRGLLQSVDTSRNRFRVDLRPFYHNIRQAEHKFGALPVAVDDATIYEIDQQSYSGSDGLQTLAALDANASVIVIGEPRRSPFRFLAQEVYAGSSVPGGDLDLIRGAVMSRSGNELQIQGATLIRSNGAIIIRDSVTVTLGENTRVKKQLSVNDHGIDEISVGQRVIIGAEAVGIVDASGTPPQFSAENGFVRLLLSSIAGTINSLPQSTANNSWLHMDLVRMNGRDAARYDFSGTGSSMEQDADKSDYQVDTGTMNLSGAQAGDPIRLLGFPSAFGSAPADFTAQSLVVYEELAALLAVNWPMDIESGLSISSESSLSVNASTAGRFHHIARGPLITDLQMLANDLQITAVDGDGKSVYILRTALSYQLFRQFTDFIAALQEQIDNGKQVRVLKARGQYDNDSGYQAERIEATVR